MNWKFLHPNCVVSPPIYIGRPEITAIMRACKHRSYKRADKIPPQPVDNFPSCTISSEKCVKCGAARTRIVGPEDDLRKMYDKEIQPPCWK